MSSEDQDEKLDYIINRIGGALEVSHEGVELLEALSKVDTNNEHAVAKAELLFGNKDSYLATIDQIITNTHLIFTCNCSEESIKHIAAEIVEFVDQAREHISRQNPFLKERKALVEYQNYTEEEFSEKWKPLVKSLSSTYTKERLNTEFYCDEFANNHYHTSAYALARYELFQDWDRQLTIKEIDDELRMLSSLRRKFDKIFHEKLSEFRSVLNQPDTDTAQIGLFWSLRRGVWHVNAFNIFAKYAALAHKNSSISKLISELGRDGFSKGMEAVHAKQIIRGHHFSHAQKSDIYGITESDDLGALLPTEIGMLSEVSLEDSFYKRFAERRLQTFSYQSQVAKYVDAVEKQIKLQEDKCGPFIVCIDTSGSMNGIPEELARTICYGLIIKSQEQKRNCFVITFSTEVEVLDISDLKNNSKAITDFLMYSFSGGTDLSPALNKALEMLSDERYCKADVLFISDFIAEDFSARTVQAITSAKSQKTRFHALTIGDYVNDRLLSNFNALWEYNSPKGIIVLKRDDRNS